MNDWEVILFIVGLVSFIGAIWFFTVKDMIKHFHYLKSQEKTNRANQDKTDYEPEPKSMSFIKLHNLIENPANEKHPYHTRHNFYSKIQKVIIFFTHTKRIISRIKRRCNQKQIKPKSSLRR